MQMTARTGSRTVSEVLLAQGLFPYLRYRLPSFGARRSDCGWASALSAPSIAALVGFMGVAVGSVGCADW
jgi:hypothetical protein